MRAVIGSSVVRAMTCPSGRVRRECVEAASIVDQPLEQRPRRRARPAPAPTAAAKSCAASQSCRAARPMRSRSGTRSSATGWFDVRPRVGGAAHQACGLKRGETAAIDCGRIPSARARLDTVAGPSFSRRSRTDTWDGRQVLRPACSRNRRLSLPSRERRSCARAMGVAGPDYCRVRHSCRAA